MTPAQWRERVEHELERARDLGKTPKAVPATEAEWDALHERFPSSLYASWFVLTGRAPATERPS